MGRPKSKAALKHVEPEEEPQEAPEEEPVQSEPATKAAALPEGTVNKAQAVRAALDAGMESPDEGVDFVKKHYGIEVSKPHFSAIKSNYKKAGGSKAIKGKPGRKPKEAPSQAVEGYLAPPPKPAPAGGSDLLDAMEAMKPLVASLGKEQVKRIVDLLG